MIDEEENNEIRKLLKSLPTVKSDSDFLDKLDRKIATLEPHKKSAKHFLKEKEGIFERTFGGIKNAWLAPALGLTAAVIFTVYITFLSKEEIVNDQKSSVNKTEQTLKSDHTEQTELKTTESAPKNEPTPKSIPVIPDVENPVKREAGKDITGSFESKEKSKLDEPTDEKKKLFEQTGTITEKKQEEISKTSGIVTDELSKERKENSDTKDRSFDESPESSVKKSTDKNTNTHGEKMEEFEKTIQKSILDKLNAVNKTNLEALRDKVNK